MAIIYCTGAKTEGYDYNAWNNSAEASDRHRAEAHEASYTGCVLKTGEHNWHDDSDFYALVWDEKNGIVREIEYATTRGWTYHNTATVDATPEVLAKAVAWKAAQLAELYTEQLVADKREQLTMVDLKMEVRSTTTPGKNKDIVGTVEWIGPNGYGPGMRVGVHVEGETSRRYLDLARVERTDLPQDMEAATALNEDETVTIARHARANAAAFFRN